jgi:predicted transposase YbfD/YdcC
MVHKEGIVIAQCQIPEKTNEITQFAPMLEGLNLKGAIITADALHTQREHAKFLNRKGAYYVLTVKDNQPNLRKALICLFDEVGFKPDDVTEDRGHGRIERRSVQVISDKNKIASLGFPHVRQAFLVKREVWNLDGTQRWVDVAYCITNLGARKARPARLGELIRDHWGIENRIHYVRDVTFDEDRSQVRKKSAPRAMASLRNLAIGALRAVVGESNIAKGLRSMGRDPMRPLALFGM